MSCRHLFFATLLLGNATLPAYSQQSSDSEALDNIIVSASRTPVQQVSVGSSMTVITRDQIEKRQARYVSDLLRAVPGFAVSQSGSTGAQTQVRVRGNEANHVLVLIDGVRANDPASGDEFRWELLSTSNIERIEIVRGPQSSLWGSDAVAGVVQVITRSGSSQPGFSAFTEGGSNSTLNAGLNGSAGGSRWTLGYALENLDTDGTNISRSGDEADGSNMLTASLTGQFDATEDLTLDFGARIVDAYSQFDPVDFITTGLPEDGDVATDSDQAFVNVGGVLTTLNGRLTHRLAARLLDTDNRNLSDGVENSSTASEAVTLSYQADVRFSKNVLSIALENETTEFRQRGQVGFGDPNQDQEMDVSSFIVDFQGYSIDNLTWLLSARYDNNSDFDNAVTGRLSLAYRLGESTRLLGNIGTGQKAPTFTERFGFFPGQFAGNPDLMPETSASIEFGVEHGFLDDRLTLNVTAFAQNLENEINGFVFDPGTSLFTAQNMDGDSIRKGVEIASAWQFSEHLQFSATYTYTDSYEEDDAGIKSTELRRPRHTGNLASTYIFYDERGSLTLVADYGGSRLDRFFPPFPAPSEIVTLDGNLLVELAAGFDLTQRINLFGRITNLLDEEYEEVYGYRNPGRAAYIGLRIGFGQEGG